MTPAMSAVAKPWGANLALNQADAQAREPAGTKSGSSWDQVSPEVRQMLAAITAEVSCGGTMGKLGLRDEGAFESTYRREEQ